ncbi:basic proline-rich protein-like [Ailuropoda melanoleuca]|uniref:basic proline-rich protein-like n=1 Tax=Ailuropoda melanoleuca TaxID=9646 RepID=UPI0014942C13|nr:basic proline-rich protein-like [Ailuropoda melanoleuca]
MGSPSRRAERAERAGRPAAEKTLRRHGASSEAHNSGDTSKQAPGHAGPAVGRGREAATSPAGTPPAPLGGRGPLHPGYPSEVEDDRPSLTCPAAAVPADPQCQPGPALQPARSEPRGARDGPGDAGHRISALTRPRDPAARRPALPAPPEAPASPLAQAAGSPATTSAPRRKSRPRPPFQPRPSEVPPRACTRTGSPPSARVGGAARAGTWGSGGAVAVFCAGDCPPPPRGGARPKRERDSQQEGEHKQGESERKKQAPTEGD